MRKVLTLLVVVLAGVSFTAAGFAATKSENTAARTVKCNAKLERGVKNTVLGVTEIPKGIIHVTKNSNILAGVTVGTVKGICNAFARTISGIVDVVTFPVGGQDKPVLKPSMVSHSCVK